MSGISPDATKFPMAAWNRSSAAPVPVLHQARAKYTMSTSCAAKGTISDEEYDYKTGYEDVPIRCNTQYLTLSEGQEC